MKSRFCELSTRWALVGCLTLGLAGCGTSSPGENNARDEETAREDAGDPNDCTGDCETMLWPDIIVDVVPPVGAEYDDVEAATVMVYSPEGDPLVDPNDASSSEHACPQTDPPRFFCSYGFHAAPSFAEVTVEVEDRWGQTVEQTVELESDNDCPAHLAYLRVFVDSDQPPQFDTVEYFNPCHSFDF